jgi:hypothetical protein
MLAMLSLLVLTPFIGLWMYRIHAAARVERKLAQARSEGNPIDAAELEAFYSLPAGETDTAPFWMTAIAPLNSKDYPAEAGMLPVVGTGEGTVPPRGEPWPEQEAAEAHLESYAASLEQMREAAKIHGSGRYPTDFSKGFAMLLPHAQALRQGSRLLELEARVRAREGDAQGAAETLHAMFQLAQSLKQEPVLVSQLVRFACAESARATLQDLMSQVEFSDVDLARLHTDLEAPDFQGSFRRALQGERVLGASAFDEHALLQYELGKAGAAATSLTRKDDLAFYLDCMGQLEAAAAKPWPLAKNHMAAVNDQLEQEVGGSLLGKARFVLSGKVIPNIEDAFGAAILAQARMRIAAAGIAIERYRQKHGRLPATLDDLAPDLLSTVPADPFDGKPLRYLVSEGEYTVYSIGNDGQDNGGQETEARGEPDVTFILPRRPQE